MKLSPPWDQTKKQEVSVGDGLNNIYLVYSYVIFIVWCEFIFICFACFYVFIECILVKVKFVRNFGREERKEAKNDEMSEK